LHLNKHPKPVSTDINKTMAKQKSRKLGQNQEIKKRTSVRGENGERHAEIRKWNWTKTKIKAWRWNRKNDKSRERCVYYLTLERTIKSLKRENIVFFINTSHSS